MKYSSIYLTFLFGLTLINECFCTEYEIQVTTGNSIGAGTDAHVYMKIIGTRGTTTEHELVGDSKDPFERGSKDTFLIRNVADVGEFKGIELKRDEAGWFPNWQLSRVLIRSSSSRKWTLFDYNDWTKPNEWFTVQVSCEPGFRKNLTSGVCYGPICGSRPKPRISGASVAPPGAWPWQAMLRFTVHDRAMFCGGSLILPQWVLTTAYCVYGKKASNIFVRLGAYYREKTTGLEQDITVGKVFIHPKYHIPNLFSNDLALLKLTRPAFGSNGVGLICLPNKDIPLAPGEPCWITGWGYLDISSGALPKKLKQAQIPLAPRSTCAADFPTRTIDASMLCAGSNITRVSGCQGDTGGPLVREFRGKWYLEGSFSWGGDCDPRKEYKHQMYSNIRHARLWIDNTIADNQYA